MMRLTMLPPCTGTALDQQDVGIFDAGCFQCADAPVSNHSD
jgi:hypothetical protein